MICSWNLPSILQESQQVVVGRGFREKQQRAFCEQSGREGTAFGSESQQRTEFLSESKQRTEFSPESQQSGQGSSWHEESGAVVDLSEYLLKGTNWRDAPKCPDFVGPVIVKLTSDGRGRGLFASQNITCGSLLLISNAMAFSLNDPHRISLLSKLVASANSSPAFLQQLYSLADSPSQTDLMIPSMDLFSSTNSHFSAASHDTQMVVDHNRIMNIIMLNAFEGEFNSWPDPSPANSFSGLWLLPSLINHSCFRNTTRLVVGEAMIIHAAADIQAGEEITISYVDVMAPLKQRQETCRAMRFGFNCECKRCVLEKSLEQSLKEVSERFNNLYSKAVDEVHSAVFARDPLPLEASPSCMELGKVFDLLMTKMSSFANLTELEKHWILAGYSCAFMGKWLVSGYSTGFADVPAFVNSSAMDLVNAMKSAVPGMLRTLSFTTLLVFLAQRIEGNEDLTRKLFQLAMDECMRIYGKQKVDVLVKLMVQSSEIVPFF